MNEVIVKILVKDGGLNRIVMPKGAVVLSAGLQQQGVVIWVKCDPDGVVVPHEVLIIATGDRFPPGVNDRARFLTTLPVRMKTRQGVGEVIIHVFDLGETPIIANLNG